MLYSKVRVKRKCQLRARPAEVDPQLGKGEWPVFVLPCSSINGVKDMVGYRRTLNLGNTTGSCGSEDDVETTAILVRCVATQGMKSLHPKFTDLLLQSEL